MFHPDEIGREQAKQLSSIAFPVSMIYPILLIYGRFLLSCFGQLENRRGFIPLGMTNEGSFLSHLRIKGSGADGIYRMVMKLAILAEADSGPALLLAFSLCWFNYSLCWKSLNTVNRLSIDAAH